MKEGHSDGFNELGSHALLRIMRTLHDMEEGHSDGFSKPGSSKHPRTNGRHLNEMAAGSNQERLQSRWGYAPVPISEETSMGALARQPEA